MTKHTLPDVAPVGAITLAEQAVLLRQKSSSICLQHFFRAMRQWEIDGVAVSLLLGSPDPGALDDWRSGVRDDMPDDVSRRVGAVNGIQVALVRLFCQPDVADRWISQPNDAFGGRVPLDVMVEDDIAGMLTVRAHLEAKVRGVL